MRTVGKLPRVALLVLPLAALVSAAAASAGSTQLYAVGVPVCKKPTHRSTAHTATCTALRRVFVKAGTKGAQRFTPLGGGTAADTMGPNFGLTPSDITTAYYLSTSHGRTHADGGHHGRIQRSQH